MRPFTKHPLSLLISASVLALSLPALAQDDAEDKELLEEITVTATKRAASVADIPFNISAIGEKELRKRNITDLKALLQDSVEISAPANSARVADSVTVRGLNVSPVNQNNLEFFVRSTLAYYLDETPLPNIGYRIKDIARVETLLGPQGTLYGSGSLGGTIRYITNQPEFDEFTADFNTGLYQTAGGGLSSDTDIVVNLPLSENLALRGSLAYLDEAGYTDRVISPSFRDGQNGNPPAWTNPNGSDRSVYENDDYQRATTGKLALAWKINDDAKLTLTHATQNQLAHGSRGGTLDPDAAEDTFQYDMDTVVGRYEEFSDRSFDLTSVDLEWALGFADLASSTSYFKDSREGQANYGIGFVYYGDWGWSGLTPENTSESPYMLFDNTYSGLSHETRLVSNNEGPLNWVGGIYYTEQKRNLTFSERFPTLDQVGGIDRDAVGGDVDEGYSEDINSNYKELAVFGELTYAITDKWDVTGGIRVFNYSDEADPQITDYAFGLVDTKGAIENKESGKRFYKLNTSYDLTDDMMLYATASQGFRRGGTNGFKDLGGNTVADTTQNYEPDSVDNYELGIKGNLFDDKLYVQTNVYRINWKNTQTYFSQDVNFFPLNGTVNGPDAVSKGWEFSSRLSVTDHISLTYGTATTQAEWAETKEVCTYSDGSECRTWEKGGKLGGAPKWRHKLGVNFDTTLDNGLGLSASLRGSYTSKIQSDRADSPDEEVYEYDAYTLWHANAGVSSDNWDAGLWIQNLANERAEVSYQSENYVGDRLITTMPRTVGVNFSYHW
ncbi:TonB-dependent receptor [Simiduia agarivorans]|uniref:Tonb-dependent receptor n=1 Tax=Simiduia agarivorans (strain DSM 21679 / JCM 13881 / BCRC 17597 / SA1) TaxID=1117647 RepID=K4KXU9_SIMAS|nr:TonB-dependent receptor [Simiduia agarivorans]AFU98747.1 tonb-dependent receptor [Simiduia agarivorans SA1 = DSM 21679]